MSITVTGKIDKKTGFKKIVFICECGYEYTVEFDYQKKIKSVVCNNCGRVIK